MTATFDLSDTDQVVFSLEGVDAKGASVPLDSGFTAGSARQPRLLGRRPHRQRRRHRHRGRRVPDANLMLSVVVTNPDGSTLNGAEAIIVQATVATTVGLVAGTPTAEYTPGREQCPDRTSSHCSCRCYRQPGSGIIRFLPGVLSPVPGWCHPATA